MRKLERAMGTNQLDFATILDDDDIKTRVGRLLCGLSYNDFCATEVLGRVYSEEETALCRLEGINCKTRGRTGLTGLTDKVLNAKMTVKAGALSVAAKALDAKADALSAAAKAIDGFAHALGVKNTTTTTVKGWLKKNLTKLFFFLK